MLGTTLFLTEGVSSGCWWLPTADTSVASIGGEIAIGQRPWTVVESILVRVPSPPEEPVTRPVDMHGPFHYIERETGHKETPQWVLVPNK
jgi:hypothetical protein